ncbi:MAG TPA: hypothetical protein ENK98_09315, partial [Epsilonproteobacteria bacterium]|nr:hypothetical protein [Campylobacterota bacterium]
MKKIILLSVCLSIFSYAGFMDSVGDIVESTLSDDKLKVKPEVTTVGTLSVTEGGPEHSKKSMLDTMVDTAKESVGLKKDKMKETSILDDMIDSAKDTIGIKDTKPIKKSSLIGDAVTAVKEVTGLEKVKKDNSYFDGGIMGDIADMIDLEKGESLGLPS